MEWYSIKSSLFNYNNDISLQLNKDEVIKNKEIIQKIYKDYEKLVPRVIYNDSLPYLELNNISIAEIKNPDVLKDNTQLYIIEEFLNKYGELIVRCRKG